MRQLRYECGGAFVVAAFQPPGRVGSYSITALDGAVSYRGAVYYSTESPKLARLNTVAAVFEFDVDAEGNTHSKLWEWK